MPTNDIPEGTFRDPAEAAPAERHAKLESRPTKKGTGWLIHFDASNGETLGLGEVHPTVRGAEEAEEAWVRAMIDVLQQKGYTIISPFTITTKNTAG